MLSTSPVRPVHSDPAKPVQIQPHLSTEAKAQEHMKLSMVAIEKGGVIMVSADGNVTAADVDPANKNPFETLLGVTWFSNRVLLDLHNAAYIDSSAVGWLMNSQKSFRDAGGKLVVYNIQPVVRQLLDVLKLGRVLNLADDEASARQALEATGGGVRSRTKNNGGAR